MADCAGRPAYHAIKVATRVGRGGSGGGIRLLGALGTSDL
jgi:hypothetical protein